MKIILLLSIIVYAEEKKKCFSNDELDKYTRDKIENALKRTFPSKITKFSLDLHDKKNKLEKKEEELKKKEELIVISGKNLKDSVIKFEKRQKKFLGCLDEKKMQEDSRLKKIVEVISTMRPAKAAEVLSVQDQEITVKILNRIDSVKASKIFNLMDKEISARIQKDYLFMKR